MLERRIEGPRSRSAPHRWAMDYVSCLAKYKDVASNARSEWKYNCGSPRQHPRQPRTFERWQRLSYAHISRPLWMRSGLPLVNIGGCYSSFRRVEERPSASAIWPCLRRDSTARCLSFLPERKSLCRMAVRWKDSVLMYLT